MHPSLFCPMRQAHKGGIHICVQGEGEVWLATPEGECPGDGEVLTVAVTMPLNKDWAGLKGMIAC